MVCVVTGVVFVNAPWGVARTVGVLKTVGGSGTIRAYKEGDGPTIKPPTRVVPDPTEERIRQIEEDLKNLRDELKKKKQ